MKTIDLIDALGALDDDTLLAARQKPEKPVSRCRRIPAALIAAALAVLMSLGAVAVYVIAHANTATLMEAGPFTNGRVRPEINEAGLQIIDNSAIDLKLSRTSNDTTISLDSVVGFSDAKESLFYLTFTVTPPAGYEFPDDMHLWCFWNDRFTFVPDDLPFGYAASTVRNPDGSASVLWAIMPMGDPSRYKMHIEIDGFGMADKEVVGSLYDGSRQIELPGHWEFDFCVPTLPSTQEIALDAAALREAGLPMTALRLSSFGGIAELDRQALGELKLSTFTVEYPDGTDYTVSYGEYADNLWINRDDNGDPYCKIVFLSPQPLSEASSLLINGVRIPLK